MGTGFQSVRQGVNFTQDLALFGDQLAIIDEADNRVRYADLDRRINAFTDQLGTSTRLLAIAAKPSLSCVVAYLAALRLGVPVLMHVGGEIGLSVADRYAADALYEERDGRWQLLRIEQSVQPPSHPDLALLLGTSGSTGSSKLVRLSAANLDANAKSISTYLALAAEDRGITSLPLSYSYGLSVLHSHLAVGAAVSLCEASITEGLFADRLKRDGITGFAGVPYSFELLVRSGLIDRLPSSIRYLTQAGGAMSADMVRTAHASLAQQGTELFIMYGQTEATARIAYLPPSRLPELAESIGQAIPDGKLWIEDDYGGRVPLGGEGELVYRGPNVMMGYAENREDFALPAGLDHLRTGDLAKEIEPGLFRIIGRKSRFVKPFGLRIGLDDLEHRLSAAGLSARVAGDDALIAVCLDSATDRARAADILADLKLEADLFEYVERDAPPLLSNGKIDYRAILAEAQANRLGRSAGLTPADELAALYARIGSKAAVDDEDSFVTLGGDSLNYVTAMIAIEEAIGRPVHGWEEMTFGELRGLVSATHGAPRRKRRFVSIDTDILLRAGAIILVICQHAFGGLMGGADVLMLLAGLNFARFRRHMLAQGKGLEAFKDFALRYLTILYAIMLLYFLVKREMTWSHPLLVSTFLADWGGSLNIYWFIESLTWIILGTCIFSMLPSVRKWIAKAPAQSALAFFCLAIIVRWAGTELGTPELAAFRTPDQMLLYFAAGWTIGLVSRRLRLVVGMVAVTTSAIAWGLVDTHVLAMAAATLLLAFVARVQVPALMANPIRIIAAASFYIYILNAVPMYLVDQTLNAQHGSYWPLHLGLALVLGIGAKYAIEYAVPHVEKLKSAVGGQQRIKSPV